MTSRKRIWIAALCLLSALGIAVSLGTRPVVRAAKPTAVKPSAPAQAGAYITNASLRAAAVSAAMALDDDPNPLRVSAPAQGNKFVLPPVEEFTLTPPNPALGINKTSVAVRFPELPAEKLPAQFPMMLGMQNVTLQRSPNDARVFTTQIDFDWNAFAKEQQKRKTAAAAGRQVPVFEGRKFIHMEPMQFLDPAEIQGALQSHQPIQFSGRILAGGAVNVFPQNELMITNLAVVEDVGSNGSNGRTFDSCLPTGQQGNPTGAWTLATLMMAMANTTNIQVAEQLMNDILTSWQNAETVNTFTVQPRTAIGTLGGTSGFLSNWPTDPNNPSLPSLLNPPFHLNAIVNRIDLGQDFNPPTAGELRFIFGSTAGTAQGQNCTANPQPFNIILEFNVPSTFTPTVWANRWNAIGSIPVTTNFPSALETEITDPVVTAGACGGNSCIAQIRTNEIELGTVWQQREFHLTTSALGTPAIHEATIAMTPDGSFNFGDPTCGVGQDPACNNNGVLSNYVNNPANNAEILATEGALPFVPASWEGQPFLGVAVFNGPPNANAFWNDSVNAPQILPEDARIFFSLNTCNGCHGAETATTFQQVFNRVINNQSNLSNFLLGCTNNTCSGGNQCSLSTENLSCLETVSDPNHRVSPQTTQFGDIARRVTYLQGLVTNGDGSGGALLPFMAQHIGVH
jgi:hypothetical protein